MEIVHSFPPNIASIKSILPITEDNIFTYGSNLYVPSGHEIPPDIMIHEKVHSDRQMDFNGAENWWKLYLTDTSFRLEEELLAYATQLKWVHEHLNAKAYKMALDEFASNLQTLYSISITFQKAQTLIRSKEKQL